jgi:hypothetical protein
MKFVVVLLKDSRRIVFGQKTVFRCAEITEVRRQKVLDEPGGVGGFSEKSVKRILLYQPSIRGKRAWIGEIDWHRER